MEMNFNHGDPLLLADQAFLFKRTVREAAMRRQVYATFMAKPMQGQPGSSLHIHQHLLVKRRGRTPFATRAGKDTASFPRHISRRKRYQPTVPPRLDPPRKHTP